ncbi:hypothetical protein B0H17DRAFT_921368 [Mycena rosella]|uniref:Uncharacterized protein n=1 Tax=Mycena rosella TaxID=1033263 RepID=A0AAD7GSG6_MYCRO|nr:hypothetical protein B0H17DRAFT_921368 [Mycena rosella]
MCSFPECQSPPEYSSRDSSPPYTAIPRPTEQILEQSRRHLRTPPTGVCIKCVGNVTLLLLGQEDNAERPAVGPANQLAGSVLLQRNENINSVVLTIEGLLETNPLPASYLATPVVRITNTLYNRRSTPSACPHSLAFTQIFPSAFRHSDGNTYRLPPTCHISFDSRLQFIKCTYRITVTVVSIRHRRTSFLTKEDSVSFELDYHAPTRPSQPLLSNASLLDTVKRCPEEWSQIHFSAKHLACDLFTPSVGTFYVADSIPFHLQLSCPGASLDQLFRWSATVSSVRVYILRQVASTVGDRIAKRNVVLGEGTLKLLSGPDSNDHTLNWEGKARCEDPASIVESFDCGPAVAITVFQYNLAIRMTN